MHIIPLLAIVFIITVVFLYKRKKRNRFKTYSQLIEHSSIDEKAPFSAAFKQICLFHEAIHLMSNANNSTNGKKDSEETIDKRHLVTILFILGAIDCSSQGYGLSSKDFIKLVEKYCLSYGIHINAVNILIAYYCNLDVSDGAKRVVEEGGELYNKWINGNTMIPLVAYKYISDCIQNDNIPSSLGNLFFLLPDNIRNEL